MGAGDIPAFDKTEDSPLLVLSDEGVVDQTKNSRSIFTYFMISTEIPIAVHNKILGCMKILYDEGERRGMKGHFIRVIRDFLKHKEEYCNLIGLGYRTEEIIFEGMSEAECAEHSLSVQIII